jgi:putative FmdB family regulatory protein
MPVYEYKCQNCGERFEKLVRSFAGSSQIICPHCESEDVRKAISLFGVGSSSPSSVGGSCAPNSL